MARTSVLIPVFVLFAAAALAQSRYMVFFSDKNGSVYDVESPIEFLSQRAIDRRSRQGISITAEDLPVVQAYVDQLKQVAGVKLLYTSKWLNGALVEYNSSDASPLEALSFVTGVVKAAPTSTPASRVKSSGRSSRLRQSHTQETATQLAFLGLDQMHADGFHGEGMLIAVMDTGFPNVDQLTQFQHLFDENRIDLETSHNFAFNRKDVFGYDIEGHGTWILSIMAGYEQDAFVGGAYKANYVLFVTEHEGSEYRVEEFNWIFAAEKADSLGVDVINTSLGYNTFDDPGMNYEKSEMDGNSTYITKAASIAASKGIVVVIAAGNEGTNSWGTITAPADAIDILAVGAVTISGAKVGLSSFGPSADGRIKPEVSAFGLGVSVVQINGVIGHPTGTSVAAPLVSSLAAGVWQALPELTAVELIDTIKHTANLADSPNNLIGYGIPNYNGVFQTTSAEPVTDQMPVVFPNPVSKFIHVELGPGFGRVRNVEMATTTGTRFEVPFYSESINEVVIDASAFANGFYVLRLTTNGGSWSYKLLKID